MKQLLDELRKELQEQNFDASGMSDEELIKLLDKAGIEIVDVTMN